MPASYGSAGMDTKRSAGRTRNVQVDPQLLVSNLICEYGTDLDSQIFAAMHINDDSASYWDALLQHIGNTAVGALEKKW